MILYKLSFRKAAPMTSRILRGLVILAAVGISACSAKTDNLPIQQTAPQTKSLPQQLQSNPLPTSTTAEHLYVAGQTGVYIFTLPLTATSKPIEPIAGLQFVYSVAADAKNIYVVNSVPFDEAGGGFLYVYFANPPYTRRCSQYYHFVRHVALSPLYVYLSSYGGAPGATSAPISQYTNSVVNERPGICAHPTPVTDVVSNVANGIAADSKYLYDLEDSGTIAAFAASSFSSTEMPSVTVSMPIGKNGVGPTQIAVTSTHLFVGNLVNGTIDDYPLPLSSSSTPTIVPVPRCNHNTPSPYGLAAASSGTKFYVADRCSANIYTYGLPLTASSKPTVTTHTNIFSYEIYVH